MAEINNAPTVNSSDLSKVVTDSLAVTRLMRSLHAGEHGQHRSIGAGRHPGTGLMRGGNDGVDISREVVQSWLDEGKLTLREEPAAESRLAKMNGSPSAFLEANGLSAPRKK